MHEDVVCNRYIYARTAVWVSRYRGEPYYFCSLVCREQFELEPGDFTPTVERTPVPPAVVMHIVS